jgi:hypothetical protein
MDQIQQEEDNVCWGLQLFLLKPYDKDFFKVEYEFLFMAGPVPVPLFMRIGLYGTISVAIRGKSCLVDMVVTVAIVPRLSVTVYLEGGISFKVVKAGIGVEATILDFALVPTATIDVSAWPLKACVSLARRCRHSHAALHIYCMH